MIADALRAEIERYAVWMRRSNPLFTKAEDGTLGAASVSRYLANVLYLIRHTPVYLLRARDRARSLGDERLAAHYAHKLTEEIGHDVWAERDLERLSIQAGTRMTAQVVPSMNKLVAYLGAVIDEDPALYLAYILFSEYLIVLLGPEWLTLLESRCGIQKSSMSVIGNHAELDREHVEEAICDIDDLVGDPRKLAPMRQVLLQSIAHFNGFCVEVTDAIGYHDISSLRGSAEHAPAA